MMPSSAGENAQEVSLFEALDANRTEHLFLVIVAVVLLLRLVWLHRVGSVLSVLQLHLPSAIAACLTLTRLGCIYAATRSKPDR